jgi:2-polyprenyl-6-methoxyphenol hydroxylase-like FAD-dependent oxidoreductase
MNIGIQDAMTVAGVLANVLSGAESDAHLDRYQAVRRPVALGVIAMTDRLTRATTVSSPLLQAVRNTAFSLAGQLKPVQRRLAMTLSELDDGRPRARIGSADRGYARARNLPMS